MPEQGPKAPNLRDKEKWYQKNSAHITLALHLSGGSKKNLVQESVVLFPVQHVLSFDSSNLLGRKWPSRRGCKKRSDFTKGIEATSEPPSGVADVYVFPFSPSTLWKHISG